MVKLYRPLDSGSLALHIQNLPRDAPSQCSRLLSLSAAENTIHLTCRCIYTIMSSADSFKIVTIAGDGIGTEVTDAAIQVLETLSKASGACSFSWDHLDWSSKNYLERGWYMPEDGLQSLKKYDAIYFGAVGWPGI